MTKSNKGDLVYIPSSVTLYQLDDDYDLEINHTREWVQDSNGKNIRGPVIKYKKTERPMNALCVGSEDGGYKKIIYESETWLVREKDVYSAKKGEF